jgi:ketosteroid isomerase-like protein
VTPADRVELLDLVHRYAAEVDARNLDAVAALFTPDGVLVTPDPPKVLDPVHEARGREAITAQLHSLDAIPRTFHAVVGSVFEDNSTGRVACVAHHLLPDGKTDLVWHVRYADSYQRTDDGWRIASRRLHIDVIETRAVARTRA